MSFPTDLDERIQAYLRKHNETWDEEKHFIYIDCMASATADMLVFEEWKYNVKKPSLEDLGIIILTEKTKKALDHK